jgi:hypothetical protein
MDIHRLEHRAWSVHGCWWGLRSPISETNSGSERLVHTLDLCGSGAKLGGFREEMVVGKIVVLHRKHKKAPCKIVWTRVVGPRELQIGIQLLEEDQNFWGLDLVAENISKTYVPEKSSSGDHASASGARSRSQPTQKTEKTIKTKKIRLCTCLERDTRDKK